VALDAVLADGRRPSLARLVTLGLIAGRGAVGAIVKVIEQVIPLVRDRAGCVLYPASVGGILAGIAALHVTGLLINL